MALRRVAEQRTAGPAGQPDSAPITSSAPRLTLCPPELRARVVEALELAALHEQAYRDGAYAVVTRQPAARIYYSYTSYSVSPSGDLRLRSNTEPVVLLRRWLALVAVGPGVLKDVEFSAEARVVAVRPRPTRRPRPRYRLEAPIGQDGNRALRAQLAALRRPETGRA